MAMTILNNPNTRMGLGELNKNITSQGISLKKIASGMRINGAQDDASGYSISESMRVRIRGLEQCEDNTDLGNNMLKVASGAVDVQVELMKKLREIALKASDDTYTQADRDVLQNETNQLLMQCNDIAWETNYNGIRLLDGVTDIEEKVVTREFIPSNANNENSDMSTDSSGRMSLLGANRSSGLRDAGSNTPELDPTAPSEENKIQGLFPPANATSYGGFSGYSPSNRIVWPKTMTQRLINYTPGVAGNFDPPIYIGDNTGFGIVYNLIAYDGSGIPDFPEPPTGKSYYIKNGSGFYEYVPVKIESDANDRIIVSYTGADIGYGAYGYMVNIDFSNARLNGNPLDLPKDLNNQSISVLCRGCYQFTSIKFETNRPAGTGVLFTPPADTSSNYKNSQVYVVGIGNEPQTQSQILENVFKGIQNARGITDSSAIDVVLVDDAHAVILHHDVDTDTYSLLKANHPAPVIYNGGIGSLSGGGEEEYGGEYVPPDPPEPPDPPDPPNPGGEWVDRIQYIHKKYPHKDIVIQSDTKSSLHTRLRLPNTTLDALFPSMDTHFTLDPADIQYPTEWSSDYANLTLEEKKAKWRDEIWPYTKPGAVASGSCVRTREKAEKFIEDLDQAIKYLLDANTTLGAQMSRLETMKNNLVTANEQVTNAESTIRDADMAKEMVNYTKSNVLAQSAQSMLVQANQINSSILDLLK